MEGWDCVHWTRKILHLLPVEVGEGPPLFTIQSSWHQQVLGGRQEDR